MSLFTLVATFHRSIVSRGINFLLFLSLFPLRSQQVIGVVPNIIISSCYQAAWEKFFRYFDVVPRFVKPNLRENKMRIDAKEIEALCDDKTLAVVGILGNHYNGAVSSGNNK